ncbi:MAG: ABC transporter permease [Litorivicinaceae bacterium]|jgi:peptide/nickel transport system permease protein|nr:ABC transporter permease [Litorivicinaceae bacterium]MDP5329110.1 ABC transporter permease [Litorivicinaceae bacterium]MDP5330888.1 ABC transporter permease [Litorivicinaceae bacterium]MDP5341214.1 ABC transporter permease [Litorivicinaceae bacterium]MDP5342410.1 ABC transporter permease [Litorivicinaceae bacterium]
MIDDIIQEQPWRRAWRHYRQSRFAVIALIVCSIIILAAVFAPWLAPQNPYDLNVIDFFDSKLPPGSSAPTGFIYWLGTDGQGRDMLSAMLYGLRISLFVGVLSGLIAILIGMALGLVAAYVGGWIEALIMRVVDFMLGFPTILVALMLLAILGQGVDKVIFALILVQWAYFARAVRSAALVERQKEYVEAAQSLGLSQPRIMFGHIMPNCLAPVIVLGTMQVASAISTEATLSFLGLGLPITEPSLGLLISNGYSNMLSGRYWISLYPGLLLLLTVFSINVVGDRLRDVLNPRLSR